VPVGIPGELYIGGEGLALGYWRRPQLTAEHFIPDPFGKESGSRLYRTGDQVRYLPDGRLEFLGRLDNQVKIRGFRIELGEIEAALAQHPGVHSAVAAAVESKSGERRLVSYLIPTDHDRGPATSDIRRFIRQRLPEYMVPVSFVFMDAFPLTPNKKVDRKRLPMPEMSRLESEKQFVAPRNALEEVVTAIMSEILEVDPLSIHDNFFEPGGHSLLAARLLARVHETFNIDVSLRHFFGTPTVLGLVTELIGSPEKKTRPERIAKLVLEVNQLTNEQVSEMLLERGVLRPSEGNHETVAET